MPKFIIQGCLKDKDVHAKAVGSSSLAITTIAELIGRGVSMSGSESVKENARQYWPRPVRGTPVVTA